MKESCGVFGVYYPGSKASFLTFDGLFTLQHRGQESAGMAVSDGQTITVFKEMGLVSNVFNETILTTLEGFLSIGHTRYSTTGSSTWANAQPAYRPMGHVGFALAHNGNLTNTDELAQKVGMMPGMVTSDSDVLAELISKSDKFSQKDQSRALESAVLEVIDAVKGAFSLVLMDAYRLIGIRDPNGLRPLCLGALFNDESKVEQGWVISSESAALNVVGAKFIREISPGEVVVIDETGVKSYFPFTQKTKETLCIFEFVYFSRPDSILYDSEVHGCRRRMGELLAKEHPVQADMVMGVPDSGIPAAEGFAKYSGIAYGQGLVKNRYIGRTFIYPTQEQRAQNVRRKLSPLTENISGKRLVVVDDSFVRGTTSSALIKMLREAGAREVHMRFSSPPFKWPCYYGIDIPTKEELLAANVEIDEIASIIGADSVGFLSLESLILAIGAINKQYCSGCLTGVYPSKVPVKLDDSSSTNGINKKDAVIEAIPKQFEKI